MRREYLGRWEFRQLKTKQRVGTEDAAALGGLAAQQDKAGTEVKVYLFSDALLVAVKQRIGGSTCRDFVPLDRLAGVVEPADDSLGIFGLNIRDGQVGCRRRVSAAHPATRSPRHPAGPPAQRSALPLASSLPPSLFLGPVPFAGTRPFRDATQRRAAPRRSPCPSPHKTGAETCSVFRAADMARAADFLRLLRREQLLAVTLPAAADAAAAATGPSASGNDEGDVMV